MAEPRLARVHAQGRVVRELGAPNHNTHTHTRVRPPPHLKHTHTNPYKYKKKISNQTLVPYCHHDEFSSSFTLETALTGAPTAVADGSVTGSIGGSSGLISLSISPTD